MKRAVAYVLAVVFVLVNDTSLALPVDDYVEITPIGFDLSQMQTEDIFGNPVSGDIFHNYEITFIITWVVWSGASTYSMNNMMALREYYAQKNINMIGIYYEDEHHPLSYGVEYYEQYDCDFLSLRYPCSEHIKELFSMTDASLPVFYLVDSSGKVIDYTEGYLTEFGFSYFIDKHRSDVYSVTFRSQVDSSVIYETYMERGEDAIYPDIPVYDGFIFSHWSAPCENIVCDTEITAMYEKIGDVNRSGEINTGDVSAILRHEVGLRVLSGLEAMLADVNGNGTVDTGDAATVMQRIVHG